MRRYGKLRVGWVFVFFQPETAVSFLKKLIIFIYLLEKVKTSF